MSVKISGEALSEYVSECDEIIQRVSSALQNIEKGEETPDTVVALYRDMHTMKGSALLFGFLAIGKTAHVMEASLDPIRKRNLKLSQRLMEASLKCLDLLERMVKAVQKTGSDEGFNADLEDVLPLIIDAASAHFGAELNIEKNFPISLTEKNVGVSTAPVEPINPTPKQESVAIMNDNTSDNSEVSLQDAKKETQATAVDTSIRVQVGLLDRLMNLVGELVLARNQVLQFKNKNEDLEFLNLSKTLDVVTSELQSEVMKTRMQPVGNIVNKFQRVVRDIAKDLNKKIDLTLEGMDTELDKTLLEAVKDPLTHIVRNACDHGIETPEGRLTSKKPENGHLLIRAFHGGGQVVIEISDDGKGLDKSLILAKALGQGLVSPERAKGLSEKDIFNFIFLPGFSTAKQVTSVSGRGVGMDVVKTNIEKIGGSVEVNSKVGKGTTLRLKIPLTLAIVPALTVKSGDGCFAIAQVKLVELVRVDSASGQQIELLQGKPMYRLRGELLPLIDLNEVLGNKNSKNTVKTDTTNIVVLNAEGEIFGLIVDEVLDTVDIVVKPIATFLNTISIFSGATLMGDGTVALVLDVVGMAEHFHIRSDKKSADDAFNESASKQKKNANFDIQEFLLFKLASPGIHSIPLCLVYRLEEFESKAIEYSGSQRVVQYRGSLLPIISLSDYLKYSNGEKPVGGSQPEKSKKEFVAVVVVQKSGRNFGIEVEEILDVVTIEDQIDDSIRDRPGLLGNIVNNGEIIVVVDAFGVIDTAVNSWTNTGGAKAKDASIVPRRNSIEELKSVNREIKSKKVRVLFAEDVAFFRKQVSKVLTSAGYEVSVFEDGAKALEALESSQDGSFNLILSDIEMPNMNGLDFAKEVRKREKFKNIPMIALTTRFREHDIQAGMQAGFNLYMEKLNPDKLLSSIETIMNEKAGE